VRCISRRAGVARRFSTGLAALLLAAGRAAAQHTEVTGSLDAGGATVAYDEFLRATVGTLSPMVRVEHGRATFIARGAYSRFTTGSYSIEGTVAGSVVSPAFWRVRAEVYGTASNTKYSRLRDDAATNVLAVGRLHWAGAKQGLWAGAGIGAISTSFFFPEDVIQAEAGGWLRVREATLTAQIQPTRIGDLSYTDYVAASRWEWRRADLALSGGFRRGDHQNGVSRWAEAGGSYWLSTHLAFVGGVGVFPAELWRGLPGGRYASTALRISTRAPRGSDPALLAELTRPYELSRLRRSRAAARQFNVVVQSDGTRTLQLHVPFAHSVELMGDFTDWAPVAMSPVAADTWTYNVFIGPGVHRINIRIDGGPWIAPPGLTVVRDDFGGAVGLLVVQ
jgi:hypothetical protein